MSDGCIVSCVIIAPPERDLAGGAGVKVVLFCGGLGTRLREHSNTIPKPLVTIGPRPILWHLMRHYAHYGHKQFVLCLGYGGDLIRDYFLTYNPYVTGDVTIGPGQKKIASSEADISDWQITMVDTGLHANLGERLLAVRRYLEDEEIFHANYSDQLSNLNMTAYQEAFLASGADVGCLSVRPRQSYHYLDASPQGIVREVRSASSADYWINGGYFICRRSVFDHIQPGEEIVEQPFARLAAKNRLWTMRFEGFWQSMDTFKDKITFDRMWGQRDLPWQVWR